MSGDRFEDKWEAPDVKFGAPPPSAILEHMPILEANLPSEPPDAAIGE